MKRFDYLGLAILYGVWEVSAKHEVSQLIMGFSSLAFFLVYLWKARKDHE